MKYIFLLFVLLLPTFSSAQTPSLYDEWTGSAMGSLIHFTISEQRVITSSAMAKSDTGMILKVIFDSTKAKGRLLITEKSPIDDTAICTFLLMDKGEGILTSIDPSDTTVGFSFYIYNSKRVAEFQKMKDPLTMSKDEAISIIHSFRDSMLIQLQKLLLKRESFSDYNMMLDNGPHVIQEILIIHGYSPLDVLQFIATFERDSDFHAALELPRKKIQELERAQQSTMAIRVQTEKASRRDITEVVFAPGTIEPEKKAHDLSAMNAILNANKNEIADMKLGDTARVTVDDFPDRIFIGTVREISKNANIKIRLTGFRTGDLRPGMQCTARIETETKTNVLSVPIMAVTSRTERMTKKGVTSLQIVFVAENGKAKSVPIRTGISDNSYVEIIEGLKGGEEVIKGNYPAVSKNLEDGKLIKIENAAEPTHH